MFKYLITDADNLFFDQKRLKHTVPEYLWGLLFGCLKPHSNLCQVLTTTKGCKIVSLYVLSMRFLETSY